MATVFGYLPYFQFGSLHQLDNARGFLWCSLTKSLRHGSQLC